MLVKSEFVHYLSISSITLGRLISLLSTLYFSVYFSSLNIKITDCFYSTASECAFSWYFINLIWYYLQISLSLACARLAAWAGFWFPVHRSLRNDLRQLWIPTYWAKQKKNNNDCNKTNFWRHLLQVYFLYSSSKAP